MLNIIKIIVHEWIYHRKIKFSMYNQARKGFIGETSRLSPR